MALMVGLVAGPATAQLFDSRNFAVEGSMTLDGTGAPGRAFGDHDLPQWACPYDLTGFDKRRSTGIDAESCEAIGPNKLTAAQHAPLWVLEGRSREPTEFPSPGTTVSGDYRLTVPGYGGAWKLSPRMQLGHEFLGVQTDNPPCDTWAEIAEDYYIFDEWKTGQTEADPNNVACVRYCPDPEPITRPPNLPDSGSCWSDPPLPAPECPCVDCVPAVCPPCVPPGSCDGPFHTIVKDFVEKVAFLEIAILVPSLDGCPLPGADPDCDCSPSQINPLRADIQVECRFSPSDPWVIKAGTAFDYQNQVRLPGQGQNYVHEDSCLPGEIDDGKPRVDLYFPVPAERQCRLSGRVWQETCNGPIPFDVAQLLWPSDNYHQPSNDTWYHDFHLDGGGWSQGEQVVEPGYELPTNEFFIIKNCDGTDEHTGSCCGPEYGGLHGEFELLDSQCRDQRDLYLDNFSMRAFMPGERTISGGGFDMGACPDLFVCKPELPYTTLQTLLDNGIISCYDDKCERVDSACNPVSSPPMCGEWQHLWGGELPTGNMNGGTPAYDGNWWALWGPDALLEHQKHRAIMARVTGLHGLLMADDLTACVLGPEWRDADVYPNVDDIAPGQQVDFGQCASDGLFTTNDLRQVIAGTPAEVALLTDGFQICDGDPLYDIEGDLHFVRVRSYPVPPDRELEPIFPTWIPDRTLCSDFATVRGIVRVIDGNLKLIPDPGPGPDIGVVHEIGQENPYTLSRFFHWIPVHNNGRPLDWETRDICTDVDSPARIDGAPGTMRVFSNTVVRSTATASSEFSTSNAGPNSETVLQTFWANQGRCDNIEAISSCQSCEAPSELLAAHFNMPRLFDPTSPTFRDDVGLDPALVLQGASLGAVETDYYFEQIVALTNNQMATTSTRSITLDYYNDRFVSGLRGDETPIDGAVHIFDVTKPVQSLHQGPLDKRAMPPSFDDALANPRWPFIHERCPQVPAPRVADSLIRPRIDTYAGTPAELIACAEERERYISNPGTCEVENFGVCMGEVRFVFPAASETMKLKVTGAGYFNAFRYDTQYPGEAPQLRPDLMVSSSPVYSGSPVFDINEDGYPDQQIVQFDFYRNYRDDRPDQGWSSRGDRKTVYGVLPAGTYRADGFEGDGVIPVLPLAEFEIACGGITYPIPACTVTADCSQSATGGTIRGVINHAADFTYTGATWANDTIDPGVTHDVPFPLLNPDWRSGVEGEFMVDTVGLDPGCNDIVVTASFEVPSADPNQPNIYSVECRTVATLDTTPPTLDRCEALIEYPVDVDECLAHIDETRTATDRCAVDGCGPDGDGLVTSVVVELLDDSPSPVVLASNTCTSPGVASLPCTLTWDVCPGDYTLRWTFTDAAGNSDVCEEPVEVRDVDPLANAPVVTILTPAASPSPPAPANTAQIELSDPAHCYVQQVVEFEVTDRCPGDPAIDVFVTESGGSPVAVDEVPVVGQPGRFTFVYDFPCGTTDIDVIATDDCGRVGSDTRDVELVDAVDPVISCVDPDPLELNGSCVTGFELSKSATDPCGGDQQCIDAGIGVIDRIEVEFVDVTQPAMPLSHSCVPGAGAGAVDCTFDPVTCGTYTVTWTAYDVAGNSASCVETVVVDDPPGNGPFVTFIDPVADPPPAPADTVVLDMDAGACGAMRTVHFEVDDNCPVTVTATVADPWELPVVVPVTQTSATEYEFDYNFLCGTSTIELAADDTCGNSGAATLHVELVDNQLPTLEGELSICGQVSRPANECMTCFCYSLEEMFRRSLAASAPWTLDFSDNCIVDPTLLTVEVHDVWEKPYPPGQNYPPQGGCTNMQSPVSWNGGDQICIRYLGLYQEWESYVNATLTFEYLPCEADPDSPPSPLPTFTISSVPGPPFPPNFDNDHWFIHVPRQCTPDCYPNRLIPADLIMNGGPFEPCTGCP